MSSNISKVKVVFEGMFGWHYAWPEFKSVRQASLWAWKAGRHGYMRWAVIKGTLILNYGKCTRDLS